MKVGITYDLKQEYAEMGYSAEDIVEFDREDTIAAIEAVLIDMGFRTDRIGNVKRLVERLAGGERWDLVFNIAEGMRGFGREAQIPGLLEAYGIPFTFSDSLVCAIALHKGMTNRVLRSCGIPTADFFVAQTESDFLKVRLRFPVFLKPVAEGTSKGVSSRNKVWTREELLEVGSAMLRRYKQPVLVEEFLPGREFTVGIVGTGEKARALGALEVKLLASAEPEVYSFDNKALFEDRVRYEVASEDDECAAKAIDIALRAHIALGCRDVSRVDLRCDSFGEPRFLEINPLPGLNPEISDLAILCKLVNMPYESLIREIVMSALERVEGVSVQARQSKAEAVQRAEFAFQPDLFSTRVCVNLVRGRRKPRALFLHEKAFSDSRLDIKDVEKEMAHLWNILETLGFQVMAYPISLNISTVCKVLTRVKPDVVFNLSDSVEGEGRLIYLATAVLDKLGIPYAGNNTEALFLTSNKVVAKDIMRNSGIPTPRFATMEQIFLGEIDFPPPYILKSVWEDASVGLDEDSVFYDKETLKEEMLKRLERLGGSAFAEEFVDGREFNVSIISSPSGARVLPIAEMKFVDWPQHKPRVLGYTAKWRVDSFEYAHTTRSFAFSPADEQLLKRLGNLALRCWERFGLKGYARVDFRVANDSSVYVLEVNANPCLSPDSGFIAACREAMLSDEQALALILSDLNRPVPSHVIPMASSKVRGKVYRRLEDLAPVAKVKGQQAL